ncbi:Glutelin type-A 2 [Sesamum angolense]|uniref:Glutelin type-A 2 n=1 Tax=Sesamum angolense TaxID=2727404 RepID=A0AAE1XBM7_9LAMI|nr:Glutelin type-A 2 [Sesamum angolense]
MEMEIDLSPKLSKKVYSGDGGAYYAWCPNELPMLRQGNIGAAKLALEKSGFALPQYSDSAKVAYVLQGNGVAGIILPEKEEKVLAIKKGDAIALPFGVTTWWYNKDDTKLAILFLGDTSKGHKSGSFTDFCLTGSNGIFTGFSTEFVSRAWDLDESTAKTLVGSQSGKGIVKLAAGTKMPEPKAEHYKGMALTSGGSGRVQVVGVDGKRVLETTVKAGNLFIVPRFFVVSKISDADGLDWFSIITTPNPIFTHLAGRTSVWKALSPQVLQASFNVGADVEQKFSSNRKAEEIFFPPPNSN